MGGPGPLGSACRGCHGGLPWGACRVPGAVLGSCTVSLLSLPRTSCGSGQTCAVLPRNPDRVDSQRGSESAACGAGSPAGSDLHPSLPVGLPVGACPALRVCPAPEAEGGGRRRPLASEHGLHGPPEGMCRAEDSFSLGSPPAGEPPAGPEKTRRVEAGAREAPARFPISRPWPRSCRLRQARGVSLALPVGAGPYRACLPGGGSSWGAGKGRRAVHLPKSKNEGCSPLSGTHPRIYITGISERADGRKRKISHNPTPRARPRPPGEHFACVAPENRHRGREAWPLTAGAAAAAAFHRESHADRGPQLLPQFGMVAWSLAVWS